MLLVLVLTLISTLDTFKSSADPTKQLLLATVILSSELCQNTPDTLDELVNSYNTTSAHALNSYWSLCKVLSLDRECYSRFTAKLVN